MLSVAKPQIGLPTETVRTETAAVGNVRAEIVNGRDVALRIWRGGQLAYDEPLTIFRSALYDGPYAFDIRVDDRGEPYIRIGVVSATHAGRKRFPDDSSAGIPLR